MPYGTIKVDNITFTDNSVDKTVSLSGLIQNPTFTGNVTVTGTISGDVIRGGTTISGVTVTGTTANFVSGVFTTQVSGATIVATTGTFASLTGTTTTITSGVFSAGSATAPSVAVGTGTTYKPGIYSPGTDQLAISTNGTGRLFVDASGNVGLGLSNPSYPLEVASSADSTINITGGTSNLSRLFFSDTTLARGFLNYDHASDSLRIGTAGSEQMRLTSAGLLGLGTSSPSYPVVIFRRAGSTITEPLLNLQSQNSGVDGDSFILFGTQTANWSAGVDQADSNKFRIEPTTTLGAATGLTITTAGLLGLGTSSPGNLLHLSTAGTSYLQIQNTTATNSVYLGNSGGNGIIQVDGANSLNININGSERARIDSSGRLLVGTSSGTSVFDGITPQFQIEGTGYNSSSASLFANSNDTNGAYLVFGKSRGTSTGSSTIVSSGDAIGGMYWVGADGTDRNTPAASIYAFVDGTPGSNDMPGRLVFSTTLDGASSPTERLRITNGGNVGINTTSPGALLDVSGSGNIVRLGDGTNTFDVRFKGPNNWSVQLDNSADKFNIQRNSSSLVTVTSGGLVGIGITSPAKLLHVQSGSVSGAARGGSFTKTLFESSDAASTYWEFQAASTATNDILFSKSNTGSYGIVGYDHVNDALRFHVNAAERARIDSSGRLLVGTSTYTGNGKLVAAGNTGGSAGTLDICWTGSRPTAADTDIGYIRWYVADNSSSNAHYASIYASSDGASSSVSDIPGRLVFSTTADGGATPTERMRINNSGQTLINATTDAAAAGARLHITSASSQAACSVRAGTDGTPAWYFTNAAGVQSGDIIINTSSTAYNTSSDYRLKENVVPLDGAIDRVNDLQVRRFNFIADPAHTVDGFIAHEAAEVVPECVTGEKDAVDDDGNPLYQGIDQSKLVPLLTAALQEAIAKIEALETRLSALESN